MAGIYAVDKAKAQYYETGVCANRGGKHTHLFPNQAGQTRR